MSAQQARKLAAWIGGAVLLPLAAWGAGRYDASKLDVSTFTIYTKTQDSIAAVQQLRDSVVGAKVDYLICRQCNTPCYVFDVVDGRVMEAQCLVCGNDATTEFSLGEDAGSDD